MVGGPFAFAERRPAGSDGPQKVHNYTIQVTGAQEVCRWRRTFSARAAESVLFTRREAFRNDQKEMVWPTFRAASLDPCSWPALECCGAVLRRRGSLREVVVLGHSPAAQAAHPAPNAGVDNTKMGPYRALAHLAYASFQKGDMATAAELAHILERVWDKAGLRRRQRYRRPTRRYSNRLIRRWMIL